MTKEEFAQRLNSLIDDAVNEGDFEPDLIEQELMNSVVSGLHAKTGLLDLSIKVRCDIYTETVSLFGKAFDKLSNWEEPK